MLDGQQNMINKKPENHDLNPLNFNKNVVVILILKIVIQVCINCFVFRICSHIS